MTVDRAKEPTLPGHELLRCKKCGRPMQMRRGKMLTCECGALPPKGCWTRRAVPGAGANAAPLVYIELVEKARKPCTNPACEGCMVFSKSALRRDRTGEAVSPGRVQAWTCGTCGRQDIID